jgi:hypothetical protein
MDLSGTPRQVHGPLVHLTLNKMLSRVLPYCTSPQKNCLYCFTNLDFGLHKKKYV